MHLRVAVLVIEQSPIRRGSQNVGPAVTIHIAEDDVTKVLPTTSTYYREVTVRRGQVSAVRIVEEPSVCRPGQQTLLDLRGGAECQQAVPGGIEWQVVGNAGATRSARPLLEELLDL